MFVSFKPGTYVPGYFLLSLRYGNPTNGFTSFLATEKKGEELVLYYF